MNTNSCCNIVPVHCRAITPCHHHWKMSENMCDYEMQRDAQVKRNKQVLNDLNLPTLNAPTRRLAKEKPKAVEKFEPRRENRALLRGSAVHDEHNANRWVHTNEECYMPQYPFPTCCCAQK